VVRLIDLLFSKSIRLVVRLTLPFGVVVGVTLGIFESLLALDGEPLASNGTATALAFRDGFDCIFESLSISYFV